MRLGRWIILAFAASALACTSVLGDFNVTPAGGDDAGPDATTGDAHAPPSSDAGGTDALPSEDAPSEAGEDTGADVYSGPCGDLAQPCCAGDLCNDSSFACHAGYCRPKSTGDTGKPCTLGTDCLSGICLPVGQPQGGGAGWTGSVCTQPCADG